MIPVALNPIHWWRQSTAEEKQRLGQRLVTMGMIAFASAATYGSVKQCATPYCNTPNTYCTWAQERDGKLAGSIAVLAGSLILAAVQATLNRPELDRPARRVYNWFAQIRTAQGRSQMGRDCFWTGLAATISAHSLPSPVAHRFGGFGFRSVLAGYLLNQSMIKTHVLALMTWASFGVYLCECSQGNANWTIEKGLFGLATIVTMFFLLKPYFRSVPRMEEVEPQREMLSLSEAT